MLNIVHDAEDDDDNLSPTSHGLHHWRQFQKVALGKPASSLAKSSHLLLSIYYPPVNEQFDPVR